MEEKGRKKVKIRPKNIAQYWADKYIDPDGEVLDSESLDCTDYCDPIPVIPHMEEPRCMACGCYYHGLDIPVKYKEYIESGKPWKVWEYYEITNRFRVASIDYNVSDRAYMDDTLILCDDCWHEYLEKHFKSKKELFRWLYRQRIDGNEITLALVTSELYDKFDNLKEYEPYADLVQDELCESISKMSIEEMRKAAVDIYDRFRNAG